MTTLATSARLGSTRIAVTDLPRSIDFYERVIGLRHVGTSGGIACMASGAATVLELEEAPDAQPPGRRAGLFHVALLYPSRVELARVGRRLMDGDVPIQGTADHGTHEAWYLADPDGNGLELAADRPREQWPSPADAYGEGPQPLDVAGLMSLVANEPAAGQAGDGIVVGHLHLHVGDIARALSFYRDVVGFDVKFTMSTAAFVAVGDYHHHLGFNVWNGIGVPAASGDALGMRYWSLLVPDQRDIDALAERLTSAGIDFSLVDGILTVADPWNNVLRLAAG